MSLATQLTNLATRVATEAKALRVLLNGNAVDLSALTTTAKSNLVAAINELQAEVAALSGGAAGINDAVTATDSTWSSTKISDEITEVLNAVLSGAPAALDTLSELAAAIDNDASFASTVTTALGNRVRHDVATTLTDTQKNQACDNIGAAKVAEMGDPTTDFVATFNAGLV